MNKNEPPAAALASAENEGPSQAASAAAAVV
jgi:hypothetical protein